ncbi:MAG: tetratricopeptide repeat protein [Planctomycetota bacterium]
MALYARGELDRSIEVLKEAHARAPEDNAILFELAPLLAQADRHGEAAEALRTILRRSPQSCQRVQEMIEEARARRVNVSPLNDAVAEHFIRQGDLQGAAAALERVSQADIRSFMSRHRARWESVRRNAPDAKMARASLQSAYYLALAHELLREYTAAAEIYRTVARNNPEEVGRVLKRFESLLARDYRNCALRVGVADLLLRSGREEEASRQFGIALETDPRAAESVAGAIAAHLSHAGERADLRWVLSMAQRATGDLQAALDSMRRLVEAGSLLEEVVEALRPVASTEEGRAARRLLADALLRRGQPQACLEMLLQLSEEEGLPSIREPLEALAAAHPDIARAHLLLGDIHLAQGRIPEAAAAMRRAHDLAPGEDSILVPKVTQILESNPSSPDAHLLLADLQAGAGEQERAVVVLRHMVRVAPECAEAALERFAPLLRSSTPSPRVRIGAAEACTEAGRHEEALQHLSEVARTHPELTAEFLHPIAALAESAPDLYPAIAEVLRALEPRSPYPHAVRFARGDAAFHAGDAASSVTAFREVLAAAPERSEEVRQALERFDRSDPRAAEARYLLATIYLDRRDHDAAVAELARGGAAHPALLARVLARYEAILQECPDDLGARCGLVQALLLARQFDRVLSVGQGILRSLDDRGTARVTLAMGDALREKGHSDDAAKRYYAAYARDHGLLSEVTQRLQALVRQEGTHALASLAIGKVLASEGRTDEAVEAFGAASAADPKLRDTILTELHGLMVSCPAHPQPGVMALNLLLEMRDTHRALELAGSLLDAHPDLAPVLAGRLESILSSDPDNAAAHYEMGRALQRLRLHPRAAAMYLAAARRNAALVPQILKRLQEMVDELPACADPLLAISAIHAGRGKLQSAAERIAEALERAPGEADRLLPRLEEIWKQSRGHARIALLFGRSCVRVSRHDRAIAAFSEAVLKDDASFEAAFRGLEEVIRVHPKMADAHLARARAHALRRRIDPAVSDFDRAFRLAPRLLPEIVRDVEALHAEMPDSMPCAVLLADLHIAAGNEPVARSVLSEQLGRARAAAERLALRIRLWRLALARRDDEAAREHLEEATRLAPNRSQFLARVHEVHVAALRAEAARLNGPETPGRQRAADAARAIRALIELGRVEEAAAALDRHAASFAPRELLRLRAEVALRRGDYPRAAESLSALGPSPTLAFGAERAGDHALAARTLESLALDRRDPGLQVSLSRVYRTMVVADLTGGSRRLQAETILTFGEERPR